MSKQEQAEQLRTRPDEGDAADAKAIDVLRALYVALDDEERSWMNDVARQAIAERVGFRLDEQSSVRRFEIMRGLVQISHSIAVAAERDVVVRAILFSIIGEPVYFANVVIGHALGSLEADEAKTFSQRVDAFLYSSVPHVVVGDRLVLHFLAA